MRTHLGSRLAASVLLAAAGWTASTGIANGATPTETGCPSSGADGQGYQLLSVAWLESQSPNYRLPRQLDESGNQDGFVCGRETNDQAAENFCDGACPVPQLYDFRENDRTPAHKS